MSSKDSIENNSLATEFERALSGLMKLIKALSFYPVGHPALLAAAEETDKAFQPLLAYHDPRPFHVTKDGFSLDKTRLVPGNQSLQKLARQLVERRVRHLLFLPELTSRELLIFAEELTRPAAELLKAGGLPQQLADRQVASIWINETDLAAVLAKRQEQALEAPLSEEVPLQEESSRGEEGTGEDAADQAFDASVPEPPAPEPETGPSVVQQMRDLLERLKEPLNDEDHAWLLDGIERLTPDFIAQTGLPGSLILISLLHAQQQDTTRSATQRAAVGNLLTQLLTYDVTQLLVNAVGDPELKPSQRRALTRLLIGLKLKVAPDLLKRLLAERDAIVRRRYTAILARMGECIFPLLEAIIEDPQWHVVRNAVTVLGETRLESALPILLRTIKHPEPRVRRALIRALVALGGDEVIPHLIELTRDPHRDLRQPAIMALGTLGSTTAIPALEHILQGFDPLGKRTPQKLEAIRALAAIRSPQAIIPLLKYARRRNPLNFQRVENLRAEAILGLGQLGNAHLIPVLDRVPKSNRGPVSRALQQAKSQLKKNHAA